MRNAEPRTPGADRRKFGKMSAEAADCKARRLAKGPMTHREARRRQRKANSVVQIATVFLKGKVGIAAGALGLSAALAAGQTAPAESCRVRIPAAVYDVTGRPAPADIRYAVRVRQKGVQLLSVQQESGNRRVVLLMDSSGSMRGRHGQFPQAKEGWIEAREVALEFLRRMQPGDWVGLHFFATKHKVEVPLTQDFDLIATALSGLPNLRAKEMKEAIGPLTIFGEALEAVLRTEGGQLRAGDAVVLISDGDGQEGKARKDAVVGEMARNGIRLFLLKVGTPYYRERPQMTEWVRDTGGLVLRKWRLVEIGFTPSLRSEWAFGAMAELAYALIRRFDWVELEFEKCDGKARKLTLELRAEKGRKTGYEELLYPRQVVLPAPGSEPKN
jgi:Mg-chelatase subunit ChlD